jgi:hypothetical protein
MKKYDNWSFSSALFSLVVHEIPSLVFFAFSSSKVALIRDVLPVPDGADITNNLPMIKKSLL